MLMTNMALETGSIDQWRSKALRGPGSTVTWCLPFPPLHFPLSPLPLPFPSSSLAQPLPCLEAAPNPASGSGGAL